MICTSVCLSPRVVNPVGLVEPVELHEIRRVQVELRRGTGGIGVGVAFCRRMNDSSTGHTDWYHQKSPRRLAVPPVPPVTPAARSAFHRTKTILAKRLESIS